ncbi:MAG: serine/threonine-protein phosphatase, partial [Spirillospora sp.]
EMPPRPAPAPMADPMNDPMGGPPMPGGAAMRQAPMRTRRGGLRRWTWLFVVAGVVVVGVVAGGFVLVQNVRNGYYVGQEKGQAILFRGTPQSVLGFDMSRRANAKNLQPIMVEDLPQDLQQQVKDTYTVDGPGEWKMLVDRVCKYSLVDQSGKVAIVRGRSQPNCKELVRPSDVRLVELTTPDAGAITKGTTRGIIGEADAQAKLTEMTDRRDRCKKHEPGVTGCPSTGGKS